MSPTFRTYAATPCKVSTALRAHCWRGSRGVNACAPRRVRRPTVFRPAVMMLLVSVFGLSLGPLLLNYRTILTTLADHGAPTSVARLVARVSVSNRAVTAKATSATIVERHDHRRETQRTCLALGLLCPRARWSIASNAGIHTAHPLQRFARFRIDVGSPGGVHNPSFPAGLESANVGT
jgi:hypothetical protein